MRAPRVKLPDGRVALVKPAFAGNLPGFTLLFEVLVMTLAPQVADFSRVTARTIDETSRAREHNYITLTADAEQRRILAAAEKPQTASVRVIAIELAEHGYSPGQIEFVSIEMPPAFIKGCTEDLPNTCITFDKFHIV